MRRKQSDLSEAIGTDAFLDIVANLVGILLIFLMVIGVRMEDASKSTDVPTSVASKSETKATTPPKITKLPEMPDPLSLPEIEIPDATAAQLELKRIESSIQDAHAQAQELARSMRLQKIDRDNLMLAITKAQIKLDNRRAALDETQQANVATQMELKRSQEAHQSLVDQLESVKADVAEPDSEVLQHIATPIAKTVFVREEHFRLKDGRLLFVPLNDMTYQLKQDAPKKIWKLKTARQTTESIGPQNGFELRYTLRRNRVPIQTDSGRTAVREVVELDRFVMVPVGNLRGETIAEAMSPSSVFRSRISEWNPRDTIITVWTYPDSFGDFRQLKSELYQLGYLTAARPLPENQLISGSPEGTRSAAQ